MRITSSVGTVTAAAPAVLAATTGTFDASNFGDLLFPLVAEFEPGKRLKRVEPSRYSYRRMDGKRWRFDICQQIFEACGRFRQIVYIDDLSKGIRAEFIEVLVTLKRDRKSLAFEG